MTNTGSMNVTGALDTVDTVSMTATGDIVESGTGRILHAALLQTASHGRADLRGANTVAKFAAVNHTGGNIDVVNATGTLLLADVHQADGGDVTIVNTGSVDVTGAVDTVDTVSVNVSGDLVESGTGRVLNAALLQTTSHGQLDLRGANTIGSLQATNHGAGNIDLANAGATLVLTDVQQVDGGNITVANTGSMEVSGAVGTLDTVSLTSTGDIVETGTGRILHAALLQTTSQGRLDLQGANTVAKLTAINHGGGDMNLVNSAATLVLADVHQVDGGNIIVDNTGSMDVTGAVDTVDTVTFTSTGDIVESGTGRILNAALLQTGSQGRVHLQGSNTAEVFHAVNSGGGNVDFRTARTALTTVNVVETAGGNVTLVGAGDFGLDQISSPTGTVAVVAVGSMSAANATPGNNIDAASIDLTSQTGHIGEFDRRLDIDSSRGLDGTVTARADGDIDLMETAGNLNVDEMTSANGDIRVTADGSIMNRSSSGGVNVSARDMDIKASHGTIGTSDARVGLKVGGTLKMTSASDAYVQVPTGDLVAQRLQSDTGWIDVLVSLGNATIHSVTAPRVRLEVADGNAATRIQQAAVANEMRVSADDLVIEDLNHASASPLRATLVGTSGMADEITIHARSDSEIVFDELISDMATIDAVVDKLEFKHNVVGTRAYFNNSYYNAIANNVDRKLLDTDLQLYPRNDPFYLYFEADRRLRTDALVVNYNDNFIINDFSTENSMVRETKKMAQVVGNIPQITTGPLTEFIAPGPEISPIEAVGPDTTNFGTGNQAEDTENE